MSCEDQALVPTEHCPRCRHYDAADHSWVSPKLELRGKFWCCPVCRGSYGEHAKVLEMPALNPWQPMTKPIDLKHLGKLGEEANELGAAINRCIIQGIDECEPVTKKVNRQWLQDEIADVLANIDLVRGHFKLDELAIELRVKKKQEHLRGWHSMMSIADELAGEFKESSDDQDQAV